MLGRPIVFHDAEVLEHDAGGFVCRIGNARVFVGKYVPMDGTTVRHTGDRGRLVLPRWFVEQHGLPVAHLPAEVQRAGFLATSPVARYPSAMPSRDDVEQIQLATRIPRRVYRAVKIHCVRTERMVQEFVAEAIREKLAREGKASRLGR
jgi:hypothetical protein